MSYIGDFWAGQTIIHQFTLIDGSGVGATLTGSPVISIYKNTSTSETTSGVTVTVNHDSITGAVALAIDSSASAGFYTSGANYFARITTGFVSGAATTTNAIGYIVASFSLENRTGLRPTVSGRTLSVSASGLAAADQYAVAGQTNTGPGSIPTYGIIHQGTAQSATATTLVAASTLTAANSSIIGATVYIKNSSSGRFQSRQVLGYTDSTKTLTVDSWTENPTGTIEYIIFATAPGSESSPTPSNMVQISGDSSAADNFEAMLDGTGEVSLAADIVGDITGNLLGSVNSISGITFPTNFASLVISSSGYTTVDIFTSTSLVQITTQVWSNTSGRTLSGNQTWSLTGTIIGNVSGNLTGSVGSISGVTFPTNFSSLLISASGKVTVGTNDDKTGYTLTYTAAQAGDSMSLTTATQTALTERILKYDYSIITGEASRSLLNSTRILRNKWANTGDTLTVYAEDDTTIAWTATVSSNSAAEPVTSIDPA